MENTLTRDVKKKKPIDLRFLSVTISLRTLNSRKIRYRINYPHATRRVPDTTGWCFIRKYVYNIYLFFLSTTYSTKLFFFPNPLLVRSTSLRGCFPRFTAIVYTRLTYKTHNYYDESSTICFLLFIFDIRTGRIFLNTYIIFNRNNIYDFVTPSVRTIHI